MAVIFIIIKKSLFFYWCEIIPQSTVSTIPQLVIVDNCGEVWSTVDYCGELWSEHISNMLT